MNFFLELFYKKYVDPVLYPLPIEYWVYFNNALASFPTIECLQGFSQSSRRTKKIQLIVLHHSGSLNFNKALIWFKNPNSFSSVHYLIDLDGHIQQLVPDENASLHVTSGIYKFSRLVNEMSIGISLIGNGFDRFTEAQYEAVAMLCAYLKKKYGLKNEDIFKHSEIECKPMATDPHPWSKEKFNELLDKFENL